MMPKEPRPMQNASTLGAYPDLSIGCDIQLNTQKLETMMALY